MRLKAPAALLIFVCASVGSLHAQSAGGGTPGATKSAAATPAPAPPSATKQATVADQSALIAQLEREARILGGSKSTSPAEVAGMEKLVREVRTTDDAALISRAELLLVLFREREVSAAKTQALNASLKADSEMLNATIWHEKKRRLAATSFGVGIASLAVLGLSYGVNTWAYNAYQNAGSATAAAPYYTLGKVGQIASVAGVVGAVGGFGLAWLIEMNPFDNLGVRPTYPGITYPRTDMTKSEKIAYLTESRSRDEARLAKARKARFDAGQFFKLGVASTVMTAAFGYLEYSAYRNYSGARTAQDASGWSITLNVAEFATVLSASLAGIGLSGAAILYLSNPGPDNLNASINMLDAELESLRATR